MYTVRMIAVGLFSVSALSIFTYQGIELKNAIKMMLKQK